MSTNPFDEPDSDRTVIRPQPGGRRAAAPPPPSSPPPAAEPAPVAVPRPAPSRRAAPPPPPAEVQAEAPEPVVTGDTPLATAAGPLLQLLARLRNTANPPDAANLRDRATAEIRRFESRAREAGVPMEHLRPAHYALCVSLDDVVLNTPWGVSGGWASGTLAMTFHNEAASGARFFDLLTQLRARPDRFLPVIELMYLCLSLGFMGRFREAPRGQAEIDRLRADLHALIESQRPPVPAELSGQWQGVDAPYRPAKAKLPIWVVATVALAVIGGVFVFVSSSLNAASDELYARTLSVPPAAMPAITRAALVIPPPPPPPPPEPTAVDRLRAALKPQIDQGIVTVLGTASTPVIRIAARALFNTTGATLQGPSAKLLADIATALKGEPGPVQVVGYTDDQKPGTVQFPSNFQLSAARAQAVRSALARALNDTKRFGSEGRADADPLAANTTPEGREQNRRVELVLHRQG